MRKRETVEVTTTQTKTVGVTCDVCGRDAPTSQHGDSLRFGEFEFTETAVWVKEGYDSPTGGSHKVTHWDVCPECFDRVVRRALEDAGAKPSSHDVDW